MTEQTAEERERLKQELARKKEEKRREASQRKLEAARSARKRARRRRAESLVSSLLNGVRSTSAATGNKAKQANRRVGRSFRRVCHFMSDVGSVVWRYLVKIWTLLSSFAKKPWSVPVFILAAAACYTGITYFAGFKLFGLTAYPPTYQFYLCDYSVGFCSRLFVGAVIGLFTDRVSIQQMSLIINSAVCLSLAAQATIAGLLLRAGLKNQSVPAALMGLLMMTNPLAVVENMSSPGLLDVYLLILFLLWLAFLKTPLIAIVTPIFCLIGMAIHYEFLFSFLPPMLTLLLYYAFFAEKKRERVGRWIAFTGGGAVSAASFYYFVFLAKNYLRLTSEEYYQRMLARFNLTVSQRSVLTGIMGAPIYRPYFDFYIFGQYQDYDYFKNIGDFFEFLKNWTIKGFSPGMLYKDLVLFVPVLLLAAAVWGICASKEKGLKKLPYIFFVGQALVLVPELIISTDIWRWVSAALLTQFIVFAMVYFDKNASVHQIVDHTKWKPALCGVCLTATTAYVIFGLSLMK